MEIISKSYLSLSLVSFKTHLIPDSTKKALVKLHKKGIKLFVATGRGKDGLGILDELPIDGYITLNGQFCFTKEAILYENTINKQDIQALADYIKDKTIPVGFTERDEKYFNYRDERVETIHKHTHNDGHPARDCKDVASKNIYQCMIFCNVAEEKEILALMPHCHSSRWHELFVDVSPIGGSKQKGIDIFLEYFGLGLSETMAFGDGGNDIMMLKHVGLSVAMGNANDEVKRICDYVSDDVENGGIEKALKHFKLID